MAYAVFDVFYGTTIDRKKKLSKKDTELLEAAIDGLEGKTYYHRDYSGTSDPFYYGVKIHEFDEANGAVDMKDIHTSMSGEQKEAISDAWKKDVPKDAQKYFLPFGIYYMPRSV